MEEGAWFLEVKEYGNIKYLGQVRNAMIDTKILSGPTNGFPPPSLKRSHSPDTTPKHSKYYIAGVSYRVHRKDHTFYKVRHSKKFACTIYLNIPSSFSRHTPPSGHGRPVRLRAE